MFTSRTIALSFVLGFCAASAAAQTAPATQTAPPAPRGEQRIFFSLNALAQPGTQDLTSAGSFPLYDEVGQYEIRQRVGGGSAIDVGGGYRFGRHLGAGIAYTSSGDTSTANVTGAAPHPLFFDRPRAFALDVPGLRQRQRAVHLQALWYLPITTTWDVTLFGGPSILRVSQGQVADVVVGEVGPPFTAVNVGVTPTSRSGSGVGVNVGVDTTYIFLRDLGFIRGIGGGLTLRYAGGSVDVSQPGGGEISIDVGGFQIGGGLRLRF